MPKTDLTPERLREFLHYDPDTGAFTALRKRQGIRTPIGTDPMSRWPNGRGYISLLGHRYGAHQLAYLYVRGYIPEEIDHIDGEPSNNRIDNLRDVTHLDNLRNCKTPKNNTSGHMGVRWRKDRGCWQSFISDCGRFISLGHFQVFEDACAARKAAERLHGFHPNHGRTAP